MLYELNTWDVLGHNPWKRSEATLAPGTFQSTANQFAQITLLMDPDAELTDQALMQDTSSAVSTMALLDAVNLDDVEVPNLLPDG